MFEANKIYCGDCVNVMRTFPDDCIDLTVTSPPYDNLRTYNGYVFDFESIAQELYRITKPGGVVVWVVGDATIKGSETGTSFRQALYFKEIGFNLHDTMIWEKPFIIPKPANRYESSFEYMFVVSKGKPSKVNLIKDKINVSCGRKITGHKRGEDGLPIKLHGATTGKIISEFGTRHNIWEIDTSRGRNNNNHPASFPEKLANDHIISWSNPGDTVLDPMCGSGTTLKMAKLNDRKYIGIEISEEYIKIAEERIGNIV